MTNQTSVGSGQLKSRGETTNKNATTPTYVPASAIPTTSASTELATRRVAIPAAVPW